MIFHQICLLLLGSYNRRAGLQWLLRAERKHPMRLLQRRSIRE